MPHEKILSSQKKTLDDEINYSKQEHNYGESIHTVHHFNIDVRWTVGILSSKKNNCLLRQAKKNL